MQGIDITMWLMKPDKNERNTHENIIDQKK